MVKGTNKGEQKNQAKNEKINKYNEQKRRSIYGDQHAWVLKDEADKRLLKLLTHKKLERSGLIYAIVSRLYYNLHIHQNEFKARIIDITEARWDSNKSLAEQSGLSEKTIKNAKSKMRDLGILTLSYGKYAFSPEMILYFTGQLVEPKIPDDEDENPNVPESRTLDNSKVPVTRTLKVPVTRTLDNLKVPVTRTQSNYTLSKQKSNYGVDKYGSLEGGSKDTGSKGAKNIDSLKPEQFVARKQIFERLTEAGKAKMSLVLGKLNYDKMSDDELTELMVRTLKENDYQISVTTSPRDTCPPEPQKPAASVHSPMVSGNSIEKVIRASQGEKKLFFNNSPRIAGLMRRQIGLMIREHGEDLVLDYIQKTTENRDMIREALNFGTRQLNWVSICFNQEENEIHKYDENAMGAKDQLLKLYLQGK